ncbi:type IV pilus assembly protein PilM [Neisseriaceae bacterium ESL0693]|nr:type IV pilus assembly protein PilM [Neisseriaceae bacterium ESL0693]
MKLNNFHINSKSKKAATGSSKQCVGINITPRSINMVLLSARSLNQIRLEKYVISPLPKNIIMNGNVENYDDFVVHIQQAWKTFRTNCKNITVAMPQKSVNMQFITISSESDNSVEEQVMLELNQTEDDDNLSYDYQELPTHNSNTELLLVSSKREDVDRLMDAFTDAGITPTQMDVDIIAVMNSYISWINENNPALADKTVAIFDISQNETRAIFMRSGLLVYKQEINLGYEQMVQLMRRDYQLTEEEAWDMFYSANKRSDYIPAIAQPFQNQLIQEIQRTLQFYFTASGMDNDSNIEQIMIFGYNSNDAQGLAAKVQEQTQIPTQQINPVDLAELNPKMNINQDQFLQDSNLLTVPFGLAVRGL